MTWTEVWKAARGLYSVALVVALLLLSRALAPALRILAGLSEALTLASRALLSAATSAETQARMEAKLDEIHAAVVRKEPRP